MKRIKALISVVMIISICLIVLRACDKKESTEIITTSTTEPTQVSVKAASDKIHSIYTPDDVDTIDMTNSALTGAQVIATFNGVQNIDIYNSDVNLVLNLRDDGSCELLKSLDNDFETIDTGTYTKNGNLYSITFKTAGQVQSKLNNETQDITVCYVTSNSGIGDIDVALTLDKSSVIEAAAPSILFSFSGGFCNFDLYDDNTFRFTYPAYQVEEIGTWVYDPYKITFTKSDGSTVITSISRSDYSMSFVYVSVTSDQLKDEFTCPYDSWGILFK